MPNSASDPYRLEVVKICGNTTVADRDLVSNAGADYFGVLVDVGYSPRSLSLEQAVPLFESPPIPGVVSLVDPSLDKVRAVVSELDPAAIQFLGRETPDFMASVKSAVECEVWKSLQVPGRNRGTIDVEAMVDLAEEYEDSGVDAILFTTVDSSGGTVKFGTGLVGDWGVIRGMVGGRAVPCYLGGGLYTANILTALSTVKPAGIDVCSGVEKSPGLKDPDKLAELFEVLSPLRAQG